MKLLIMQFSPAFYHFTIWTKYSSQGPFLKHPQSVFFPYWVRRSLTRMQNHSQNYSLCSLIFKFIDRG
jgi:hypothetical protein